MNKKFSVRFITILRKNRTTILLGVLSSVFYFVLLEKVGGFSFIRHSFFSTGDSKEYRDYAFWLQGKSSYCNPLRTFFYPMLLMISGVANSIWACWIMQYFLWMAGCILLFYSVENFTAKKWIALLSFILALTNISLIVYTAHALTEITAFFFLSLIMFTLSKICSSENKIVYCFILLFAFSCLATTKPLFQPLWFGVFFLILIFQRRTIIQKPLVIFYFLICISPVLTQEIINKAEFNSFSSTGIADYNLKNYLYPKVKFYVDHPGMELPGKKFDSLSDSAYRKIVEKIKTVSSRELTVYFINHVPELTHVFLGNVDQNLSEGNPYINRQNNHSLAKWVENTNRNVFRPVHYLIFFTWICWLLVNLRRPKSKQFYILFVSGILLYYSFAATGSSFWAGDRLVVSSVGVWTVFYPFLLFSIKWK